MSRLTRSSDILEWDVATWARALHFWEDTLLQKKTVLKYGLELGAHHGGLSLFFAKQYGAHMVCSDLDPVPEKARILHRLHRVEHLIQYAEIDACVLPFPDQHFDFVVFKSMLGAVGRNERPDKQQQAIKEMYRVLKPGGLLFFAENAQGSVLHRFARRWFVPWGKSWRYVTLTELQAWLSDFEDKQVQATGFLSAFLPGPQWLKTCVARLDRLLTFLPQKMRYVAFGYAQKQA